MASINKVQRVEAVICIYIWSIISLFDLIVWLICFNNLKNICGNFGNNSADLLATSCLSTSIINPQQFAHEFPSLINKKKLKQPKRINKWE